MGFSVRRSSITAGISLHVEFHAICDDELHHRALRLLISPIDGVMA